MDQNLTTTNNVIFGNLTLTGNLNIGSNVNVIGANNLSIIDNMIYLNANNTVDNPDLGFAANYNDGTYHHTGFFRDASDGYWKVFDNYDPEPDANVYIDTTNTSFHLANFQANSIALGNTSTNWAVINTSGIFAGSTLVGNSTGAYGKTEGSLNVNNATTAYGKTEGNLNVNSALTSNNSTNLGGVAAASYVNTAGAYTITGVHTHNANVVIASGSGVSANGGFGSNGQALTSNGSAVYWSTIVGTNTAAQYTWTNNHTFSANVALNGFVNSPIKMSSSPFIEMTVNISSNYTVSNNYNALTAGPVTIDSGVTVTVPTGSTWTVV
jgi:hypothetical protein